MIMVWAARERERERMEEGGVREAHTWNHMMSVCLTPTHPCKKHHHCFLIKQYYTTSKIDNEVGLFLVGDKIKNLQIHYLCSFWMGHACQCTTQTTHPTIPFLFIILASGSAYNAAPRLILGFNHATHLR